MSLAYHLISIFPYLHLFLLGGWTVGGAGAKGAVGGDRGGDGRWAGVEGAESGGKGGEERGA